MSIDISRVAWVLRDLCAAAGTSLTLSHTQQYLASALRFKSLAAYQAAKKLETNINDNGLFIIVDNESLIQRSNELGEALDGIYLPELVGSAIKKIYPAVDIHFSKELRRVLPSIAIARLVGLNPFLVDDLDEAKYRIIENKCGEVQGFLFDFNEPAWAEHAAHILQRHGSLSVYAPVSVLRILKGCEIQKRRYLHGDQHEDNSQIFFCSICHQFADTAHFSNNDQHDHGERYFEGLKRWEGLIARVKLSERRPLQALNIVRAKAEAERSAAEAARSNFHRWIEQQVHRNGAIGKLAKDIMRDPKFPTHAETRSEIISHIACATGWSAPKDAAILAWREFNKSRKQI